MTLKQRFSKLGRAFASAGECWAAHEDYRLGASLSYYGLFSIFPMLLLCATVFGIALGNDESSRVRVLDYVASALNSPQVDSIMSDALSNMQKHSSARGAGLIVAIVGLFFGASGVFSELDTAFNRVWGIKDKETHGVKEAVILFLHDKLLSFFFVLLACAALLVSLVVSVIAWSLGSQLSQAIGAPALIHIASPIASGVLGLGAATAMMKILPRKKVPLRDALAGALVTTTLLFGLKYVFALYLSLFTGYAAYGVVGGLLALVTWIYLAALILLYGAEFSRAWHDMNKVISS
ncbi:MAG: YihY/virulence factor BrkB family protein [Polyangiaceae bacterium]